MKEIALRNELEKLSPAWLPNDGGAWHFGDTTGEYHACTGHAGIADLSARGRLEVTGKDRVRFLHNTCTNDINTLPVGQGCEAFFLDAKGRVLFYATIFAGEESISIDIDPGQVEALLKHLDRYIIREDVQLHDRSTATTLIHVLGPQAGAVLSRCADRSLAAFVNLAHAACMIADVSCQARRHDRSVLPGFDILMPDEHAPAIWQALRAAGGERLWPVGLQTLEVLRIEAGIPSAGKEVGADNIPQELGRNSQAISFTKGCYIGQETVARVDAMGHVNRMLRGLTYSAAGPALVGALIKTGDKEIGRLGGSEFSPRLGLQVGLSVLRIGGGQPGAKVILGSPDGPIDATVCALPI